MGSHARDSSAGAPSPGNRAANDVAGRTAFNPNRASASGWRGRRGGPSTVASRRPSRERRDRRSCGTRRRRGRDLRQSPRASATRSPPGRRRADAPTGAEAEPIPGQSRRAAASARTARRSRTDALPSRRRGRIPAASAAPSWRRRPTVSIASKIATLRPARARAMAADRPFGPAPMTIASGDAAIGLLRLGERAEVLHRVVTMLHELSGYWYSRWLFERGLAVIYLVAFLVAVNQFVPLARRTRPAPGRAVRA